MPFTPAHAAVVVPLARFVRHPVALPALVVGSMSPDFEYFASLRPMRTIGHDLIGIPLLCVPSGLAVLWAFDRWMKAPVIGLLPGPLRRRLGSRSAPIRYGTARGLLTAVAFLAIGAFSHIAWDSLTHRDSPVVARFPALSARVGGGPMVCQVLQHASTAVGLSLLASWSWRRLAPEPEAADPAPRWLTGRRRRLILAGFAAASLAFAASICARQAAELAPLGLPGFVVRFLILAITASLALALAYSLAVRGCGGLAARS